MNDHGWSLAAEDWEPFGLFELRIECLDSRNSVVGQLLKLTFPFPVT